MPSRKVLALRPHVGAVILLTIVFGEVPAERRVLWERHPFDGFSSPARLHRARSGGTALPNGERDYETAITGRILFGRSEVRNTKRRS